jgi:hypothetical protein
LTHSCIYRPPIKRPYIVGTAIGAGLEIKSLIKSGSAAYKAIAAAYTDDVAEAISKYGDDFVEMAKHCDDGTVLQAKRFYADIDEAIRTASGRVIQGSNYSYNVLKPTELMDELARSGVKYNPDDVIAVVKTSDGKIVWLENGTETAGLKHIIKDHGTDFANKGITQNQIPDYIIKALSDGKVVGYQGRGIGRPIYEFMYNGKAQRVAITTGNNGFIVGANPVSIE